MLFAITGVAAAVRGMRGGLGQAQPDLALAFSFGVSLSDVKVPPR